MNPSLRAVVVTWLAAYPTITLLVAPLRPITKGWPLPLQTLLLASLMVPLMVLWVRPFVEKTLRRFGPSRSESQ